MVNKLKNMSMGATVVIGLFALAFYYLTSYNSGEAQQSMLAQFRIEKQQKETKIKQLEQRVQAAKKYDLVEQKMGEILTRIITYIPSNLKVNDVSRIIQKQADRSDLSILNLAGNRFARFNGNRNKNVPFEPLSVKASLEGDFVRIMEFLSSLTQIDKIITIDKMSFNLDNKGKVKFSAEFKGYRYVDNSKGGK